MSASFKAVSIAIKALAKPIINYFTYYNRVKLQESNHYFLIKIRDSLTNLGQKYHYYTIVLNRKVFKLSSDAPIKLLSPDKALERGAELISEIIIYSILIVLPSIELIKAQFRSKDKEKQKNQVILDMRSDLNKIIVYNYSCLDDLDQMKKSLLHIKNKKTYSV